MPLSPSKSPASPGQIRRPLPRSTLPAASLGAPVAKLVLGGWSPGICSANNPVALPDLQGLKSPPSSFGCHGGGRREESGSCCGLCRYGSPHFFLFPWFACSHIPAWLPAADALFILRQRCAFLLVSFRSVQKSVEGLAEEIPIPSSTSPSGGPHRGSWGLFSSVFLSAIFPIFRRPLAIVRATVLDAWGSFYQMASEDSSYSNTGDCRA